MCLSLFSYLTWAVLKLGRLYLFSSLLWVPAFSPGLSWTREKRDVGHCEEVSLAKMDILELFSTPRTSNRTFVIVRNLGTAAWEWVGCSLLLHICWDSGPGGLSHHRLWPCLWIVVSYNCHPYLFSSIHICKKWSALTRPCRFIIGKVNIVIRNLQGCCEVQMRKHK